MTGALIGTPKVSARLGPKSVAVLPFDSLSEKKQDSYFADGIHDEILLNLARVSQLKVISRTSVIAIALPVATFA